MISKWYIIIKFQCFQCFNVSKSQMYYWNGFFFFKTERYKEIIFVKNKWYQCVIMSQCFNVTKSCSNISMFQCIKVYLVYLNLLVWTLIIILVWTLLLIILVWTLLILLVWTLLILLVWTLLSLNLIKFLNSLNRIYSLNLSI